ncbi:cupin domain-containing protein [Muricoccus aerilatus]|uniref:cupin domain-containing protein n=1 Tax=Muricoccus aerilatus TaxID=452982 RepID=UPI000694BF38|nr:cupin domain-containing protein [Roseomonas aerilata]
MTDMADLPVQLPEAPRSAAAARARFFNSGNAFNIKLPPVRPSGFPEVLASASAPEASTGLYACDQSAALGCSFPATTPLMLARYARIRAGEALTVELAATGVIVHALRGRGDTTDFTWSAGDIFLLPGGQPVRFQALEDTLLWVVTDEPLLALEGARPTPGTPLPVHYPATEIERQLAILGTTTRKDATSGMAVIFSSEGLEEARNITPLLTLSLNTLPPHGEQRAHWHNSAAITLVLQGEACHSMIAGEPVPWQAGATLVTPPGDPHSHHNAGPVQARFLIVQDGGLHYHARTMDFTFLE